MHIMRTSASTVNSRVKRKNRWHPFYLFATMGFCAKSIKSLNDQKKKIQFPNVIVYGIAGFAIAGGQYNFISYRWVWFGGAGFLTNNLAFSDVCQ